MKEEMLNLARFLDTIGVLLKFRAANSVNRSGIEDKERLILHTIKMLGGDSVTVIAKLNGLAASSANLIVKRMEEKGWISKDESTGDGREMILKLTDTGKELLEKQQSNRAIWMENVIPPIEQDEKKIFEAFFKKTGAKTNDFFELDTGIKIQENKK